MSKEKNEIKAKKREIARESKKIETRLMQANNSLDTYLTLSDAKTYIQIEIRQWQKLGKEAMVENEEYIEGLNSLIDKIDGFLMNYKKEANEILQIHNRIHRTDNVLPE